MIESLQQFVETTDPIWQWLAIIAVSAIPFVESYFGSVLGVVAGVSVYIAIPAAIIGNWLSMFGLVMLGHKMHGEKASREAELSPKKQKFKKAFDKYGVAGVSLFGQTILPSQLTAMMMVTLGANKGAVLFWQTISIIIWGVAFGVLAVVGVDLFNAN